MAPLIRACLAATAEESSHLIVVSDAEGMLLWIEGDPRVRLRAADSMNFAEGTLWSERGAGTNAIGTAIAARHAVQVFATEHFNEVVQEWTCAAAPVRDPDTGEFLGVIDLTGVKATVHPHSMAVATATAKAVEAQLRCEMLDRDRRLLRRYGEQLMAATEPRALVASSGRVIAAQPRGWLAPRLTPPAGGGRLALDDRAEALAQALGPEEAYLVRLVPPKAPGRGPAPRLTLLGAEPHAAIAGQTARLRMRQAEILTLLCSAEEGCTGEELSVGIYGTPSRGGAIRVEIFRLRKLLGEVIGTEPYRLVSGVVSDVAEVRALLHRGQLREAAARYAGPVLARSRAPGVVEIRETLDRWVRQSVLTAGDPEALWAWLQTSSGDVDLAAWQRLLANVPFADPRRSRASARVAQLRAGAAAAG
jgi:hypothetical protein